MDCIPARSAQNQGMLVHIIRKCVFFCIAVLFSAAIGLAASDESFEILKAESLGEIKYEAKQKDVVKLLGQPKSKGKDVLWEATGEYVQEWRYPAHGIELQMASKKKAGAKTVFMIKTLPGCKFASARGIKIGSTLAEVRKAYGEVEDKSETNAETFVAGSIYGGVIFSLKDNKVTEIFIGAAAE